MNLWLENCINLIIYGILQILDEEGNALGPNQQGEIYFKQQAHFLGYYGEPEKSKEAFKDGWVATGDLGYFDDEGFIFVTERIKDMLKTWIQCSSGELEAIINEIEGVHASAVVGVVHESGLDIVYAFVIKNPDNSNLTEEFIEQYVADRVHEHKRLTGGVHFVEKIPRTPTGKVRKTELREMAKKIHEANQKIENVI